MYGTDLNKNGLLDRVIQWMGKEKKEEREMNNRLHHTVSEGIRDRKETASVTDKQAHFPTPGKMKNLLKDPTSVSVVGFRTPEIVTVWGEVEKGSPFSKSSKM